MVSGRSRGRGGTQHIASCAAENSATSCVAGPLRAGASEEDPGQPFFGSDRKKRQSVCTVRTVGINCIVRIDCIVLY